MRVSAGVDLPVVISYGKEKHPGKASLYLQKTPLSELTFLVSQAMYRAKRSDEKFLRGLRIDKRNVKDIIFIRDNKIINIHKNLEPEGKNYKGRYSSDGPANYVLEINAGLSDTFGIKKGDDVFIDIGE